MLQDLNQGGDEVRLNNRHNLLNVSGSDITDSPASFLADTFLGRGEKSRYRFQNTTVDNSLGLHIVTGYNITQAAQGGSLDGIWGVPKEL